MKISFAEIKNFRRLQSVRIDLDSDTTVLVGPNNSGKTSAMLALRYLLVTPKQLTTRDVYAENWTKIIELGSAWESGDKVDGRLTELLPSLDLWLDVPMDQTQYVIDILPSLDWEEGLLGVRLQYIAEKESDLRGDYNDARSAVEQLVDSTSGSEELQLWPKNLIEFLERRFHRYIKVQKYVLSSSEVKPPESGIARIQALPREAIAVEDDVFRSLIRVNEIPAQRRLGDRESGSNTEVSGRSAPGGRRLSEQLRVYYDRHIDPSVDPTKEDLGALAAVQQAEQVFDEKLRDGFRLPLEELESLGYPGFANPKISVNTKLKTTDGLSHSSSVQYELSGSDSDQLSVRLPEEYAGLGYQNLISMVFMLLAFRDEWMRVGKATQTSNEVQESSIEPVHLVLIEEPEVHLHAQVQQVFIKKAHGLLTNHEHLSSTGDFVTQLVVSTHSSHIAHETDFAALRYFRRRHSDSNVVPSSTVANLSELFGTKDETQRFVKRYLKAVHCDLFFADAAIFVEGQAERILVPHFVEHKFPSLTNRYISLLEVGGAHAHRFRRLVETLAMPVLVISDLDSVKNQQAVLPKRGDGQVTSNSVLKEWLPRKKDLDELLDLSQDEQHTTDDSGAALYVAYQKEMIDGDGNLQIPRTFEDALIFSNQGALKKIDGVGSTAKIQQLLAQEVGGKDLANAIFEIVRKSEKAGFALDCLNLEADDLVVPPYIQFGLEWLEGVLGEKVEHGR